MQEIDREKHEGSFQLETAEMLALLRIHLDQQYRDSLTGGAGDILSFVIEESASARRTKAELLEAALKPIHDLFIPLIGILEHTEEALIEHYEDNDPIAPIDTEIRSELVRIIKRDEEDIPHEEVQERETETSADELFQTVVGAAAGHIESPDLSPKEAFDPASVETVEDLEDEHELEADQDFLRGLSWDELIPEGEVFQSIVVALKTLIDSEVLKDGKDGELAYNYVKAREGLLEVEADDWLDIAVHFKRKHISLARALSLWEYIRRRRFKDDGFKPIPHRELLEHARELVSFNAYDSDDIDDLPDTDDVIANIRLREMGVENGDELDDQPAAGDSPTRTHDYNDAADPKSQEKGDPETLPNTRGIVYDAASSEEPQSPAKDVAAVETESSVEWYEKGASEDVVVDQIARILREFKRRSVIERQSVTDHKMPDEIDMSLLRNVMGGISGQAVEAATKKSKTVEFKNQKGHKLDKLNAVKMLCYELLHREKASNNLSDKDINKAVKKINQACLEKANALIKREESSKNIQKKGNKR